MVLGPAAISINRRKSFGSAKRRMGLIIATYTAIQNALWVGSYQHSTEVRHLDIVNRQLERCGCWLPSTSTTGSSLLPGRALTIPLAHFGSLTWCFTVSFLAGLHQFQLARGCCGRSKRTKKRRSHSRARPMSEIGISRQPSRTTAWDSPGFAPSEAP